MKTLSISELRKNLPDVIDGVVASNQGVVITRHGRPVASVQPYQAMEAGEERYPLRGSPIRVADDFDAPTPEMWDAVAEEKAAYTASNRKPKRSS